MKISLVFTVLKKEILDIIRDRRTLIFMILLPLLIMPLLISLMQTFIISGQKEIAKEESIVAIVHADQAPELVNWLKTRHKDAVDGTNEELNEWQIERLSGVNAFIKIRDDVPDDETAYNLLRDKEIHAFISIPDNFEATIEEQSLQPAEEAGDVSAKIPHLVYHFLSTEDKSDKAKDRLDRSLESYRELLIKQRFEEAGYTAAQADPVILKPEDRASSQEIGGKILGSILPYLIILMTFGGATFPAIQLGAGEKEQKTLETLLVSPIGRIEMVTGKFITIVATGMISAILSLIGMYYAMTFTGDSTGLSDILSIQMDMTSMVLAALLIVPLALVFAALLLMISVYAKNFREAQSYMAPLNFAIILPAFASFLPGVELNAMLSMVPVVNVSLVLRRILSGDAMEVLPYYGIAFASTLVIAAIAVYFCALMFKREKAVFNTD